MSHECNLGWKMRVDYWITDGENIYKGPKSHNHDIWMNKSARLQKCTELFQINYVANVIENSIFAKHDYKQHQIGRISIFSSLGKQIWNSEHASIT